MQINTKHATLSHGGTAPFGSRKWTQRGIADHPPRVLQLAQALRYFASCHLIRYNFEMSSVTFDTLKYAKRLEAGGFPLEQAEALAEAQKSALSEALDTQLATKGDLIRLDGRINLIQWMLAFNLAFTMAMLWKIFS